MAKSFRGPPPASSVAAALSRHSAGTRVVGDPRQPGSPVAMPAQPIQGAPPAADVPAPSATAFNKPVPKVTWPLKTEKSLQSVSAALGDAKQLMSGNVLDVEEAAEPGESHVKTLNAVEHDLATVSEGINDKHEEDDSDGEG